ncbi:MAG: GGDEF domain-containing protein [Acidimicrobiales bacterium]
MAPRLDNGIVPEQDWEDASARYLIHELPDLVCRFTPEGRLLYVNRAYAAFHATEPEDMIGRSMFDYVDVSVAHGVRGQLDRIQSMTPDDSVRRNVHQSMTPDGQLRWHEWTDQGFFSDDGHLLGFMSIGRDLTDVILAAKRAEHDLLHDDLTGVLNRRGVMEYLNEQVSECSGPFLIGFVDIDRFKAINDQFGHRAGDDVLIAVARTLTQIEGQNMVGRIGGDEFVAAFDGDTLQRGDELAAALNRNLNDRGTGVTVSCGWAVAGPGSVPDELLNRADWNMYRSRRRDPGRTRWRSDHKPVTSGP